MALAVDIVTLFPEMFSAVAASGISRRALERGLWSLDLWNPRDFTEDNHRTVDDRPFGGGPGMVMLARPLERAIGAARARQAAAGVVGPVIYFSPQGAPLTHKRARAMSALPGMVLLCGRYEAVDQRLLDRCVDEEISLGDFVLSGGEIAALALIDAMVRLLPGATNDPLSVEHESFADGLLDCPQYTRPEEYDGVRVPDVLMSGHHEQIRRWRLKQSLGQTLMRRPDLLTGRTLTREEATLLAEFRREHGLA